MGPISRNPGSTRPPPRSRVAATSAGNAWAVGQDYVNGKTIILHWDGTVWK